MCYHPHLPPEKDDVRVKKIQYVKDGDDPVAIVHNACPSCLEHFFDMNGLVNHLNQQHLLKERIEDCAIIQRKSNSYCFFPAFKLDNSRISSIPKTPFKNYPRT